MSDANERRWATALASLDANLLVALDALLQEANVTRAAKRIGITQSAMSQTLGRLRRQFDDPVLIKVGRHMEPSPFGLRIRGRLHTALAELEAVVRDRPSFDPGSATDRFVIATVDYLAMLVVPKLRAAIAATAPGVSLAVHALDADSITAQLAAGTVHAYLGVRGQTERALQTHTLYQEHLKLLVDREHPLARATISTQAWAQAAHVHVSPRRERGSVVGRALAAAGYDRRVALEVPFFALLPGVLSGTDLVATVPGRIAEHFAEHFGLVVRDPPIALPPFEVCVAWHPMFATEPSLAWFRDVVARAATDS